MRFKLNLNTSIVGNRRRLLTLVQFCNDVNPGGRISATGYLVQYIVVVVRRSKIVHFRYTCMCITARESPPAIVFVCVFFWSICVDGNRGKKRKFCNKERPKNDGSLIT